MRRIAAVFASKRTDRSDAASSTAASSTAASATSATDTAHSTVKPSSSKRFFRSLSRKSKPPLDPVVSRLSSTEIHPPSSSSSSSGAPTTPDDDRGSLLRAPANKEWLSLPPVDPRLGSFHHLEPAFRDRTRSPVAPPLPATPSTLDTEEDDSDTEESSIALDLSKAPERAVPLAAPAYLLALTSSNLRLPYAPPPLLHVPGRPMFPRSCNPRRSLPCSDSLETIMHRKKLQRRLHRADLSPAEARSIAPFAGRRHAIKERLQLHLDDVAITVGCVQSHSAGLRRWVDRPCFEDRTLVLLPENIPASPNGELQWTRVAPATGFGVAALEFSIALELLADLYEDSVPFEQHDQTPAPDASALGYLRLDTQLTFDLAPTLTLSPTALSPSSSVSPPLPATMPSPPSTPAAAAAPKPAQSTLSTSQSRGQSYKASPSPLRMEAGSASPPTPSTAVVSPVSSAASTAVASPVNPPSSAASPPPSTSSPPPPPLKSALKQGVRFAEEEKEDQIPLGYVMRIRRKREEKARFLQSQRERRKHDDERLRHEEEKRKWEEERATWEREKRAMEEERKKRMYTDEVAAARSRRDSQRFGFGAMAGEGLATGQWDRSERPRLEREGSSSPYSRAAYDPATHPHMPRSNSDSLHAMPKTSRQGSSSGSGSPADSRPNSVYGTGSAPGSRPASMHSGMPTPSSSQQDVRSRERRISASGSRRGSMVSEGGGSRRQSQHIPVPPLPAVWPMAMSPSTPMPMPMMVMPMGMPMQPQMYGMGMGMDMPLLPPSPPFMMQQYGPRSPGQSSSRTSSPQRSHSSSPTLGRQNLPASGSSERVNRMSQARGSSASARAPSLPRSESSPRPTRAHHQRTSSGEIPPRPGNHRSSTDERPNPRPAAHSSSSSHRPPAALHSSSLPPHPPPAFSQARSSWVQPKAGFENLSRPSSGRRQTMIS
ncbi:hypothetical protein OH76DRAFT_1338503 [Lentinus brumalis]|uniref:Uncharacterized protein n=1 Tax=Lentinus brumalis TaxID=2498619 RepID=A0A371DSR9_9APHY|nr:hypothetical protein OH76DRAFT_1338503 [Polyporus brumalis]